MIAKVSKGAGFGRLADYLYGPGKHEEHEDAHLVGGNVAVKDDPKAVAAELRELSAENPQVRQPVFHVSLSLPEGEKLTDREWAESGQTFMDRMGFTSEDGVEAPWVMVRHDGDRGQHAHLVASRVRFDGSRVDVFRDWRKSHSAARAIEAQHGLSSPEPSNERLATVSRSERESASRRGVQPERAQLRGALEDARDASDGTRESFEEQAGRRGVLLRANEASTGRMNGYSVSLDGWKDAQGEQVWMPASRVHKSLSWRHLDADLKQRRAAEERAPMDRALRTARQRDAARKAAAAERTDDRDELRESAAARALREARQRDRERDRDR